MPPAIIATSTASSSTSTASITPNTGTRLVNHRRLRGAERLRGGDEVLPQKSAAAECEPDTAPGPLQRS
jgi:hypothetical protein